MTQVVDKSRHEFVGEGREVSMRGMTEDAVQTDRDMCERMKSGKVELSSIASTGMPPTRLPMAPPTVKSLAAENALLGQIVEDLQRQLTHAPPTGRAGDAAAHEKLQQTEDALIEMNEDCQAMAAQKEEAVRAKEVAVLETRRDRVKMQQALHAHIVRKSAVEKVLLAEVAQSEEALEEMSREASSLREGGEEAMRGMEEAQSECNWLHDQLQTLLDGKELSASARGRVAMLPSRESAASAIVSSAIVGGAGAGSTMQATRTAYVRAVQRCHELQLHAGRAAEAEAALRPELVKAMERIALLEAEGDALRSANARTAAAARTAAVGGASSAADACGVSPMPAPPELATLNPSRLNATPSELTSPPLHEPTPSSRQARTGAPTGTWGRPKTLDSSGGRSSSAGRRGGGGGGSGGGGPAGTSETATLRGELARAHAYIGELEGQLERRGQDHQGVVESLCAAQRDATSALRTLQSERAWVAALDEMRLDDLKTIQQLESRLEQWSQLHPPARTQMVKRR